MSLKLAKKAALIQVKSILGIVINDSTIAVSEIEQTGKGFETIRCGEFSLPEEFSLEELAAHASDFKAFLKNKRFKSRKAVIGLSAKHLLTTDLEVPSSPDVLTQISSIKLNLERKIQFELSELAADYWEKHSTAKGNNIIVVTTLQKYINTIRKFLEQCKITALSITGSTLGLDLANGTETTCNIVLLPASIEILLFESGELKTVKYISNSQQNGLDKTLAEKIKKEINRIAISSTNNVKPNYYIWENEDVADALKSDLDGIFGNVEYKNMSRASGEGTTSLLCSVASSLAEKAVREKRVPIDFLNSHLTAPTESRVRKILPKIIIASVVVIAAIGLFFGDWMLDRSKIKKMKIELNSMAADVQAAEEIIDRVNYTQRWFAKNPVYLKSIRKLTLSFPERGTIWLNSLAIDETLKLVITGKADNGDAALDVLEKLNNDPSFQDVKTIYQREAGKGSELVTFAYELRYIQE